MQLVERGKLSLDQRPRGDRAGTAERVQVLEGFDAEGKPRLRPAETRDHSASSADAYLGLRYDIWNGDIVRYLEKTGTPGIIQLHRTPRWTLPLIADPGEKWEYGISIDWAGKAVEAASGQTLDKYMQENLLGPLGMTDTGLQDWRCATTDASPTIHARKPEGLVPTDIEIPQNPEFHMGGGGLYSTVGDYLKFTQMILHGGMLNGVQVLQAGDRRDDVAQRDGRSRVQRDEDRRSVVEQRRRFRRRHEVGFELHDQS